MEANKTREHQCWKLYCSCGKRIAECGVHDNPTPSVKILTRTRGCARCQYEAQYVAFEKSYRPLRVIHVNATQQERANVMVGSSAKPAINDGSMCPFCKVRINESHICPVCGRLFQ
jgi:hypothetical protein